MTLARDSLGLDHSESVGQLHMRFWGSTLARNIPPALAIYADILHRPHFPQEEAFDPERQDGQAAQVAWKVPQRFGRLQRKYGRWGLAYLESLVRATDALASQAAETAKEGSG